MLHELHNRLRATRENQQGVALLTVLVALMIISIMLFEFQYSAMVERKLAYNELNQLQAYYLAKSGIHIGLLRIDLYGRARRSPVLSNIAPGVDIKPYLDAIWNIPLPAFPPDAGNLGKMVKADKDAAEKTLSETKVTEGKVTHVITSEASKINLNFLEVPQNMRNQPVNFNDSTQTGLFIYVGRTLINLINNFIRESDNPTEEYGNIRPEEIVENIMDWVTPGDNSFRGGNKDAYYEGLNPPYKAKRNRLYTLEELKLVRDIDDHLFNKLKPYVTVYSYDGKINLNTAGKEIYKALYPDFTDDDIKRILEERDRNNGWPNEKAFMDFAGNIRPGIKTYYSDANDYPFTVASQSFVVESLGMINRSGSSIQKMIRVAVALTRGKGGTVDSTITDPNTCQKQAGRFWDGRTMQCRIKPRNTQDCLAIAGTETPDRRGCQLNNVGVISYDDGGTGGGSSGGTGGTGQKTVEEPNAMKVLYWYES